MLKKKKVYIEIMWFNHYDWGSAHDLKKELLLFINMWLTYIPSGIDNIRKILSAAKA